MLTLSSVLNETTVFTDRPERDAFPVHTMSFITAAFAAVSAGDLEDDSFFVDQPNAAFSCAVSSGEVVRAVFVLRTPLQSDLAITFDAEVLYTSMPGSIECEGPAVRFAFIDDDEDEDIMRGVTCSAPAASRETLTCFSLSPVCACMFTLIANAID